MAEISRNQLYPAFANGQRPDENDFRDLIDSAYNKVDDRLGIGWHYFHLVNTLARESIGLAQDPNINRKRFEYYFTEGLEAWVRSANGWPQIQQAIAIMPIAIPRNVQMIRQISISGRTGFLGNEDPQLNLRLFKNDQTIFDETILFGSNDAGNFARSFNLVDDHEINSSTDSLSILVTGQIKGGDGYTGNEHDFPIDFLAIRNVGLNFG